MYSIRDGLQINLRSISSIKRLKYERKDLKTHTVTMNNTDTYHLTTEEHSKLQKALS